MPFGSLWLPVVASALAIWFTSAILHMVLRYHRADYKALPDEEAVRAALRKSALPPGVYPVPYCADGAQMKDPAMIQRYKDGPVALINVMASGAPNMGKTLGQWFVLIFLASLAVGYVARHALAPGASGMEVMCLTGTVAFAIFGFGYGTDSIWRAIPWSNSLRGLIDALVYGVVTGLVFRLLWPAG